MYHRHFINKHVIFVRRVRYIELISEEGSSLTCYCTKLMATIKRFQVFTRVTDIVIFLHDSKFKLKFGSVSSKYSLI